MNITTRTGLVGFLLALSSLLLGSATAAPNPTAIAGDRTQSVESRLARLTAAIQERKPLISEETQLPADVLLARAWGNGSGGGFANRVGGGGFVNGSGGGGFANARPWANGSWVNGGGFYNYR